MGYKFNVFTGTLDVVGNSSSGGTGVTRVGPTVDRTVPRWAGNSSDTISGSSVVIQDSGAVTAAAYVNTSSIDGLVDVKDGEKMIAPGVEIGSGGVIRLGRGSKLILI